jgi:hypothetical protein
MSIPILGALWVLVVATIFGLLYIDGVGKGYTGGASR